MGDGYGEPVPNARGERDDHLGDADHLQVEDQLRIGRNSRDRLGAIGKISGNSDATFSAHREALNTNVPALDDLTRANLEFERLTLLVS